jgi:type II restriction enzyme
MNLQMPEYLAAGYKSPSQKSRVVSEAWGKENLYCGCCGATTLVGTKANTKVVDFFCGECDSTFQLKSRGSKLAGKINDADYEQMRQAVIEDRAPNLLALHYLPGLWKVENLFLIPRFVFSLSCIEKRKPLSDSAERHGWIGCNILLSAIPPDARIPLVKDGIVTDEKIVRKQYARLRPLEKIKHDARGWTLDVLNVVRGLNQEEFTLQDVYAFTAHLESLHPANRHVRDKIRQQLQVLRDLGLVEFLGRGRYRCT